MAPAKVYCHGIACTTYSFFVGHHFIGFVKVAHFRDVEWKLRKYGVINKG